MDPFNWNPFNTTDIVRMPMDEEAYRYRMLAYLQRVRARYQERKLYPYLDELSDRIALMERLRVSYDRFLQGMSSPFTGNVAHKARTTRAPHEEVAPLPGFDALVEPTLSALSEAWEEGCGLRRRFSARLHLEPIGVQPLRKEEGYLLLRRGMSARVYMYAIRRITSAAPHPAHHEIATHYVSDYALGITCTFEHVKLDLVRRVPPLPNPAVFAITAELDLPAMETFVPLAKQLIHDELLRAAT